MDRRKSFLRELGEQIRDELESEGCVNLPEPVKLAEIQLQAEQLPAIGRSTLMSVLVRVMGFEFRDNPLKPGWFVQTCVYQILNGKDPPEFVLTCSEGRGKGAPELARQGLGHELPGAAIMPYAARQVQLPLDQLKTVLLGDWAWWDGT